MRDLRDRRCVARSRTRFSRSTEYRDVRALATTSPNSSAPSSKQALAARGIPRFHARQIFRWIHHARRDRLRADDRSRPRPAGRARARRSRSRRPASSHARRSTDGTEKFLLRLADGRHIESVFIPDTPAMTFCISTQVGCAMACAFCLTGKMGLVRNLTAGEIVGQVRVLARRARPARHAVQHRADGHGRAAAQLRRDDEGAADPGRRARVSRVPPRRVTLSTVGLLPALERLAHEPLMPNLAISLHAPTDEQRERARADQPEVRRRRHHRRVPALPAASGAAASRSSTCCSPASTTRRTTRAGWRGCCAGVKAKVNLIPLNAAAGHPVRAAVGRARRSRSRRSSPTAASRVSVRKSRGRDIRAACGQLHRRGRAGVGGAAAGTGTGALKLNLEMMRGGQRIICGRPGTIQPARYQGDSSSLTPIR